MEYELRRAAGGLEAVPLARPTGPVPWGPRISYICSAGMNPAGIKVLASRGAKTLGEERRRSPDQRPPGGSEKERRPFGRRSFENQEKKLSAC